MYSTQILHATSNKMIGHEMWGNQGEENECSQVFKLRTATGTVNTRTLGMSVELQTATILPAPLILRCKHKEMSESKLWNAPECSARSDRRTHRRLQVSTKLLKDDLAKKKKDKMHKIFGCVRKIERNDYCFFMPVRLSAWNNSDPTGRVVTNFDICVFFETLWRKFNFH